MMWVAWPQTPTSDHCLSRIGVWMGASGSGQAWARLRPVASAPADARRLIRRVGSRWALPPTLIDDVALVAGALVLESVRHARSPLELTVTCTARAVVIEVEDSCSSIPYSSDRSASRLDVVRRAAAAYGFVRRPAGRQLWARVDAAAGIAEGGDLDGVRVGGCPY